jgi:hypothetical protein
MTLGPRRSHTSKRTLPGRWASSLRIKSDNSAPRSRGGKLHRADVTAQTEPTTGPLADASAPRRLQARRMRRESPAFASVRASLRTAGDHEGTHADRPKEGSQIAETLLASAPTVRGARSADPPASRIDPISYARVMSLLGLTIRVLSAALVALIIRSLVDGLNLANTVIGALVVLMLLAGVVLSRRGRRLRPRELALAPNGTRPPQSAPPRRSATGRQR